MTDIVERVAKAIFAAAPAELGRRALGDAPALSQRIARTQACAAIKAMQEPSAAMIAAGQDLLVRQVNVDEAALWRVMADAALNGDPGDPCAANDHGFLDDIEEAPLRRAVPVLTTVLLAGLAAVVLVLLYLGRG